MKKLWNAGIEAQLEEEIVNEQLLVVFYLLSITTLGFDLIISAPCVTKNVVEKLML